MMLRAALYIGRAVWESHLNDLVWDSGQDVLRDLGPKGPKRRFVEVTYFRLPNRPSLLRSPIWFSMATWKHLKHPISQLHLSGCRNLPKHCRPPVLESSSDSTLKSTICRCFGRCCQRRADSESASLAAPDGAPWSSKSWTEETCMGGSHNQKESVSGGLDILQGRVKITPQPHTSTF